MGVLNVEVNITTVMMVMVSTVNPVILLAMDVPEILRLTVKHVLQTTMIKMKQKDSTVLLSKLAKMQVTLYMRVTASRNVQIQDMEIQQIVNARKTVHKVPIHTQIHQQIYVQRAIVNVIYA